MVPAGEERRFGWEAGRSPGSISGTRGFKQEEVTRIVIRGQSARVLEQFQIVTRYQPECSWLWFSKVRCIRVT